MINKVKIFANDNQKCQDIKFRVIEELTKVGFELSDTDYQLAIAIGGDGSFLRMIKDNEFNSDIFYVGINGGTLGFLQEIKAEESLNFFKKLKEEDYIIDEIGIQKTDVFANNKTQSYYSLNEIVVRDIDLNTVKLKVIIDGAVLENYVGDGLLISSSIGSTAYNLSFGGSIVYSSFHTLQITPIAPLNNRAYRNLLNSVIIPQNKEISIYPQSNTSGILLYVDGESKTFENIEKITTVISNKTIKCIKLRENNYIEKINDKFLKN